MRGSHTLASSAAGDERRRVTRRHRAVQRELAELVPVPRVSFARVDGTPQRVLRKQHARAPRRADEDPDAGGVRERR